jgi:hypothetical protein
MEMKVISSLSLIPPPCGLQFFCTGRSNLFAICNNIFSKWWEELRMSCRRVLSSTPLLVRGSETVRGNGERKLTNKKYKYYKLLESGKQVVRPVSTQVLVGWWLGERGDEFIGVYTDANIIMGAESADFFFYYWYLKVLADDGIWNIPGDIHY